MTAPVLVKDLQRTAIKSNLPDLIRTEFHSGRDDAMPLDPTPGKHRRSNNQNNPQEYNPADLSDEDYDHEAYVKEHMDKQAEADAAEAALKAQEKAELEAEVAEMRKQHFAHARAQEKRLLNSRNCSEPEICQSPVRRQT